MFVARDILPTWDKQIQSLCYQVNQIIEKISNIESNWMTRAMDEQMVHWFKQRFVTTEIKLKWLLTLVGPL